MVGQRAPLPICLCQFACANLYMCMWVLLVVPYLLCLRSHVYVPRQVMARHISQRERVAGRPFQAMGRLSVRQDSETNCSGCLKSGYLFILPNCLIAYGSCLLSSVSASLECLHQKTSTHHQQTQAEEQQCFMLVLASAFVLRIFVKLHLAGTNIVTEEETEGEQEIKYDCRKRIKMAI